MERLYRGIYNFQTSHFKREEEFFRKLSGTQKPEVMFITCADARVDPNLVTQSKPGDLFILRNVGNIIPPYAAIKDKNSVAAALEFAVIVLKVSDVIVCGHSNCGAMMTFFEHEQALTGMPHLIEWLKLAQPVKEHVERYYCDCEPRLKARIAEKENVLAQLRNIETYPFVQEALDNATLHLHGWYYDIGKGAILSYNPETDKFEKI